MEPCAGHIIEVVVFLEDDTRSLALHLSLFLLELSVLDNFDPVQILLLVIEYLLPGQEQLLRNFLLGLCHCVETLLTSVNCSLVNLGGDNLLPGLVQIPLLHVLGRCRGGVGVYIDLNLIVGLESYPSVFLAHVLHRYLPVVEGDLHDNIVDQGLLLFLLPPLLHVHILEELGEIQVRHICVRLRLKLLQEHEELAPGDLIVAIRVKLLKELRCVTLGGEELLK
mmetsp:Transcript_9880/g.19705  ORF Transcript_9880/g.19705 Transcript_9880/m.19705 type:complete len:224 (-) Transcript_9880:171-842(-)